MAADGARRRTALAIRHVAFEDLGSFAPVLARRGFAVAYLEAGVDDIAGADPLTPELVVVLGGPIGACEESAYPFLADELGLIERRLAAGRPILGICLGAQLMARALGARVYPGAAKEIGWAPLALTAAGRESCLAPLAERPDVLHWHGDTFDLPAGARLLASTPLTANQAFAAGGHALALQFHLEVSAAALERWYIGHACEIAATGVDPAALRADAARFAPALAAAGPACLERFLDGAGL